ncbi:hypothetical protein D4R42_04735 [bacterium]|nr:MAG: hypothetical protein D4R42_04735 [bacterium]
MKLHFPELVFPAAHYIPGQGGKCEGVHGHNYIVRDLTIDFGSNFKLNDAGMIVDFGVIKGYFKDEWDHKLIVPDIHTTQWIDFIGRMGILLNLRPLKFTTCEWMAETVRAELTILMKEQDNINDCIITLSLYEGPNQDVMV